MSFIGRMNYVRFGLKRHLLGKELYEDKKVPKKVEERKLCAICLLEFLGRDKVTELDDYGHYYHTRCLGEYFELRVLDREPLDCPLCRRPIDTVSDVKNLLFPLNPSPRFFLALLVAGGGFVMMLSAWLL